MSRIDYELWVSHLIALLDRIELEEDWTLAEQRFDIAEELGMTIEFGEPISGALN